MSNSWIYRIKQRVFGFIGIKTSSILDGLPVCTGENKCRKCGSTTWGAANTDPNEHPLKAGIIECSDCTTPNQLNGPTFIPEDRQKDKL